LQDVSDNAVTVSVETFLTGRTISETLTVSPRYAVLTMKNGTATDTAWFESTQKTLTPNQTYKLRYELGELPPGDYTLALTVISDRHNQQEERTYHIPFSIE